VFPLHWVWLGAHTPVHPPVTHVWPVHVVAALHCPSALHVDTPLPEHSVSLDTHTPVQTPATHVEPVHAVGSAHIPSVPHVSTPLPEHCSAPGLHDPAHAPAVQTPMHGSAALQTPAVLHV
jgi:hypothetical protein